MRAKVKSHFYNLQRSAACIVFNRSQYRNYRTGSTFDDTRAPCYKVVLKEQKQEEKRFLKRNLPNVGMAGWRHWLSKYTDKESTLFHNIATFHTTIPTYVAMNIVPMLVSCCSVSFMCNLHTKGWFTIWR